MKAATCVLLACFTATVSAQEQKAAGQGAIQEVLIPWSNELPENWQKENEHGYASFEKGKKESYGNTLRITMGHSDLAEHLVEDHGCPAWVAELYKNDPKSLSRMHEGFMLKSKSDRLKADYDRHMKIKRREPGFESFSYFPELAQHYVEQKTKVDSQFKMLRVWRVKAPDEL